MLAARAVFTVATGLLRHAGPRGAAEKGHADAPPDRGRTPGAAQWLQEAFLSLLPAR